MSCPEPLVLQDDPAESFKLPLNTIVMLQMVRLNQLLEGCQDLRERLLGLLAPRELALLASCSLSLHSVVAQLPEALWLVRVLSNAVRSVVCAC